ncbi:MAG: ferritin-like domain-containing protein [Chitinophagaceae bacterium]|nr:ferritin-like domain-containing protein [Chitinophagaceae bacterium]
MFKTKNSSLLPEAQSGRGALSRRRFLGYAGGAAALAAVATGCTPEILTEPNDPSDGVDLGSGDVGILNYAYALEQLEAAFYTKVIMSQYSGITAGEADLITDVRDHEIAHREFFKNALGANAIGQLEFDFSSIDFGSRQSVLATAKAFEDLGVSAYNGAGRLIESVDYLIIAGKIVSVEARHAAYFRDLIQFGSFSDEVVNAQGLDTSRKPKEVLAIADPYIVTVINADNLPTY